MAFNSYILLFLFVCTVFFNFIGPAVGLPTQSVLGKFVNGSGQNLTDYPFYVACLAGLAFIVAASVATGTFSFPNPYTIFSTVFSTLLTLATVPFQLFGTLPSPINILLVGGISFLYLIELTSWYKNG